MRSGAAWIWPRCWSRRSPWASRVIRSTNSPPQVHGKTLFGLDSTIAWQRLCFPATELRASAAWQSACWICLIDLTMLHRAGWRGSARLLNSMPNGNEILTPDGEGGYRGPYEGEVWYAKRSSFLRLSPARERRTARALHDLVSKPRSTHSHLVEEGRMSRPRGRTNNNDDNDD